VPSSAWDRPSARAKREDVSIAGLVREAAVRALEDASMDWSDIDAVVIGKAPDMFEGVMMPELYLAPALGAVGKPMIRVHTAGSVGDPPHRGRPPGHLG
jgi:acetyl-CoA C-acetyltransferase